jgi:hypothetical protein
MVSRILVFSNTPAGTSAHETRTDGVNVQDVLEKGLNDLMDLCDVVIEKFTISRDEFKAK